MAAEAHARAINQRMAGITNFVQLHLYIFSPDGEVTKKLKSDAYLLAAIKEV